MASPVDCCQWLFVSRSAKTSFPPIRPAVSNTRFLPRAAALNTRAVLQYDHHVTAIGALPIQSCTTPCCARIAAGYALAVLPSVTPISKSGGERKVASEPETNCG